MFPYYLLLINLFYLRGILSACACFLSYELHAENVEVKGYRENPNAWMDKIQSETSNLQVM